VARTSEATATDTNFILVFLQRIDVSILASGSSFGNVSVSGDVKKVSRRGTPIMLA
jgi:hypothetical protein